MKETVDLPDDNWPTDDVESLSFKMNVMRNDFHSTIAYLVSRIDNLERIVDVLNKTNGRRIIVEHLPRNQFWDGIKEIEEEIEDDETITDLPF